MIGCVTLVPACGLDCGSRREVAEAFEADKDLVVRNRHGRLDGKNEAMLSIRRSICNIHLKGDL